MYLKCFWKRDRKNLQEYTVCYSGTYNKEYRSQILTLLELSYNYIYVNIV